MWHSFAEHLPGVRQFQDSCVQRLRLPAVISSDQSTQLFVGKNEGWKAVIFPPVAEVMDKSLLNSIQLCWLLVCSCRCYLETLVLFVVVS